MPPIRVARRLRDVAAAAGEPGDTARVLLAAYQCPSAAFCAVGGRRPRRRRAAVGLQRVQDLDPVSASVVLPARDRERRSCPRTAWSGCDAGLDRSVMAAASPPAIAATRWSTVAVGIGERCGTRAAISGSSVLRRLRIRSAG